MRQVFHNATDRDDEAHVQHLVGFIQDENLDALKGDGLFAQMVDQAARSGHQDIDAGGHGAHLATILHAAEHHGDTDAEMLAIGLEALADLGGEFAGGGQNQNPAAATGRRLTVGRQAVQDRQGKGSGLASAGLGNALQVATGHDTGNGLGLDRGGLGIAFFGQRLEKRLGQAKVRKSGQNCSLSRCGERGRSHSARVAKVASCGESPRVAGRSI